MILNDRLHDHTAFIERGYSGVTLSEERPSGLPPGQDVYSPYHHSELDVIAHLNLDTYHHMAKLAVAEIDIVECIEELNPEFNQVTIIKPGLFDYTDIPCLVTGRF